MPPFSSSSETQTVRTVQQQRTNSVSKAPTWDHPSAVLHFVHAIARAVQPSLALPRQVSADVTKIFGRCRQVSGSLVEAHGNTHTHTDRHNPQTYM